MYLKQCLVTSNVEFFKGDIQEIIKSHKTIKQWAYILHDKDDTAKHYHIYLNFGSSGVDTKQIGGWFGLQESQVEKIKGRKWNALEYLLHSDNKQKYKHQYEASEVIANFDFETEITNAKILGDFENFSYAEQLDYVHGLPVSEKTSAFSKLEKLWKLRCQWLTLHSDRKIEVMFIYGKGGTGKTYYAKKLLRQLKLDFCISSSSNDPLQDYLGQKAIILDDFRDRSFKTFEDCLKMLDNDTASSVNSRFHNKVFNGEMIVITTSIPLNYWFHGKNSDGKYFSVKDEDFWQFYRRISCYVHITKEEVTVYNEIDEKGNPSGLAQVFKNELLELQKQPKEKRDFGKIFEQICEPAITDIFDKEQLTIGYPEGKGKFKASV